MSTCIVIHGFTGSPAEIQPLANELTSRGYDVITPVLSGHCASKREMEHVTANDWLRCVDEVIKPLALKQERIHLIGFSMGALIATQMAKRYDVQSLALLSAPVYYTNPQQLFRKMAQALKSKVQASNVFTDFRRYISKVSDTPLRAVVHFRRLIQLTKPVFPDVHTPVLIIQGMQDDLVEPRSAEYIYHAIGSEEKVLHWFDESPHLICLGEEQAKVCLTVADFVDDHDGKASTGASRDV